MQFSAHIVVALIALIGIGGATRVMEAGLACPDWPLCYGSLYPGSQMNMQVFLEWFHRLDAFFVALSLLSLFVLSCFYKTKLPKWMIWISGFALLLILIQASLGALTVLQLLPSSIVSSHFVLGLFLVGLLSGLTQKLNSFNFKYFAQPLWWRLLNGISIFSVIGQCLIGSRMATQWAAQRCIAFGDDCYLLNLHRFTAFPVTIVILLYVLISLFAGGWSRSQWPFLVSVLTLVFLQVGLGIFAVRFSLSEPFLIVGHQLVAALLVAFLSALSCRSPVPTNASISEVSKDSTLEVCHG